VAFIRKRGSSYYLLHNVRVKGRVRQLHLARLGRRPRINDEVIQEVRSKHPFVNIDWTTIKDRASRELVRPFEKASTFFSELLNLIRNLNLEIAELPLTMLAVTLDRELYRQLLTELKLLRNTLEVKLSRRRKPPLPSGR